MKSHNQSIRNGRQASGSAWLLVLSIILLSLLLRAPITAVGPIVEQISESMGLSGAMTGLLTTLPLLAFAFISPFAPRIAARIGMELSLFASSLLLLAAIIIRSLPSVYALFLGTLLLGMAIAVGNVLLPSLVKRDFPNKIGLMTGIYSVAMNLGAALGSGISVPLIEGGFSWQTTLAATAIIALVSVIVWLPIIGRRNRVQTESAEGTGTTSDKSIGWQALWRSSTAWSVSMFLGLQCFCFYVNVSWIPLILTEKGLSHSDAGWMISLMQLVGVPTTFIVPILAGKRASQRGLATLTSVLLIAGYFILLTGGSEWITMSIVLLGVGTGGGFGLALMFFALRTRTSQQSAELSGMAQSIGYLLAASGPFLFGLLHDYTGGWNTSLVLILIVSILYGLFGLTAGKDRKV